MLSYMLPVDEKPPSGFGKDHLQLAFSSEPFTNGRTPISKEISVSSFVSDATTTTASYSSVTPTSTSDKVKPKLVINGAKHQTLKRVSFGSSKGSMVETLIFETSLREEPEPSPILENPTPFPEDYDQIELSIQNGSWGMHVSSPVTNERLDGPVVGDSYRTFTMPILRTHIAIYSK